MTTNIKAVSSITLNLQQKLDSLANAVLQNQRRLDLLTAKMEAYACIYRKSNVFMPVYEESFRASIKGLRRTWRGDSGTFRTTLCEQANIAS